MPTFIDNFKEDIHHKTADNFLKTLQENEMNGIEKSAYLHNDNETEILIPSILKKKLYSY